MMRSRIRIRIKTSQISHRALFIVRVVGDVTANRAKRGEQKQWAISIIGISGPSVESCGTPRARVAKTLLMTFICCRRGH